MNVNVTMLASERLSSSRAHSQPMRGRKEDPFPEEWRARGHWRAPRLQLAEEPEVRRAPRQPMVQDFTKLLPVMLVVLLVEKALENHLQSS